MIPALPENLGAQGDLIETVPRILGEVTIEIAVKSNDPVIEEFSVGESHVVLVIVIIVDPTAKIEEKQGIITLFQGKGKSQLREMTRTGLEIGVQGGMPLRLLEIEFEIHALFATARKASPEKDPHKATGRHLKAVGAWFHQRALYAASWKTSQPGNINLSLVLP